MTPNFWYDIIRRLRKRQDTFKEQLKILLWFPLLPTDRDLSRLWTTTSFYCRIIGMICRHHHLLRAIRIEKNPDFSREIRIFATISSYWYDMPPPPPSSNTNWKKKPKSVENRRKSPKTTGIRETKIEKKIFDQDISLLEII